MKKRSIQVVARTIRPRVIALTEVFREPGKAPKVADVTAVLTLADELGSYFENAVTARTMQLAVAGNRSIEPLRDVVEMIETGLTDASSLEVNRIAFLEAMEELIAAIDRAYPRR